LKAELLGEEVSLVGAETEVDRLRDIAEDLDAVDDIGMAERSK